MKRYLVFTYFMLFGLSLGFAQSGRVIDDIYVTPNDAQMVNEVKASKKAKERKESQQSAIYRNGAREIVFIDQYGNKTTAISDTVYIVDNEVYADTIVDEEGYYLNEFKGSKSDFEYAERIRKFHNPRYTITIADPGYNDVYFLDNNYWNVYMDGMYSTITPTWNNPYYWDYQYSPFSYNSWAWRYNWGYPSWGSYYGMGWSNPWYSGYYGWGGHYGWGGGWYDPWYSPWYSGYYGWGGYGWGYPYYGGYYGYGYGYPYYGGGYGYGGYSNYNSSHDQSTRRELGSGRYTNTGMRSSADRRTAVMSSQSRANTSARTNDYTRVTSTRSGSTVQGTRSGVSRDASTRSSVSGVDTRTRTGAVRSSDAWNNVRSNSSYSTTGASSSGRSSTIINRSNPSTSTRSSSSTYDTRSSGTYSAPSRSSSNSRSNESSRSSSTYSAPSRSSSSSSSGSFGGSSGGGSYGGGGSSSGGSSTGGGSRR